MYTTALSITKILPHASIVFHISHDKNNLDISFLNETARLDKCFKSLFINTNKTDIYIYNEEINLINISTTSH